MRPNAVGLQGGYEGAADEKRRREVARHDARPVDVVDLLDRSRAGLERWQLVRVARGDRATRDVDEEADVTDLAEHALGEVHDLVGVGQIRHVGLGRCLAELPAELTQSGLVDVHDRQTNPLPGETPDDGLADAAGGSRHDGHASLESGKVHARSLSGDSPPAVPAPPRAGPRPPAKANEAR